MARARFVRQLQGPGTAMPTKPEAMAVLRELLEAGKITPVSSTVHIPWPRSAKHSAT